MPFVAGAKGRYRDKRKGHLNCVVPHCAFIPTQYPAVGRQDGSIRGGRLWGMEQVSSQDDPSFSPFLQGDRDLQAARGKGVRVEV